MPDETWCEFEDAVYKLEDAIYKLEDKLKGYTLSISKIIQNLIDIEVDRFYRIIAMQEAEYDNYEWQEIPTRTVTVTTEVPWYIDEKYKMRL